MAKTTYKVKQEDSYATLPKGTAALNPGVPRLTAGQVIYVPKAKDDVYVPPKKVNPFAGSTLGAGAISNQPAQTGMYQNSPYTGFQTPTSSTYVPKPPTGTPKTPTDKRVAVNPGTQTQTQTFTPSSYMSPIYQQTPATTQTPTTPNRPQGIYTGTSSASDQQWRDYWNWQAANPAAAQAAIEASATAQGLPSPNAVHIPTRDEIWQMKANQRRKALDQAILDGTNTSSPYFGTFQPNQPASFQNFGNAVNTALSWRVG